MTAKPVTLSGEHEDNAVEIRGRVSSAPVERELPSGTVVITFRVSISRAKTAMTSGSAQTVDWGGLRRLGAPAAGAV